MMNAQEVADHVPAFATYPYGCVAKANKPLTETCRPIHNQSAPAGYSINESLDASARPDAIWPGAGSIADRILEATALYGAHTLKAFVTDISEAFLNVGILDTDAQINGGILPLSNIATLATTCVFGNCESPGAFKILNCVSHLHQQESSIVNNINTPFDIRFYVDDGNAIEPDIGNRLELCESSLRSSIYDVFGPNSIQEDKTVTWSPLFTSLGYSWNLQAGTVSIPETKLLRIKEELDRFSRLTSASITEFRSLVGKLRHVATCCKPAGSLMALLGSGLSSHKVANGKQQRAVTTAMRTELHWWATFLTPDRFHNLPVEWLGKRENKVNSWIHCYSKQDSGVWLCDHTEGTSVFTPWHTSLLVTILMAINDNLGNHPTPDRMSHTRIILNECNIACNINQGSSPQVEVQHLFKSIGAWQLDNRHRITATTPTWERSPSLSYLSCIFHPNTNVFQTLDPLSTAASWSPKLSIGKPRLLPSAREVPTAVISSIGSCSAQVSTYLKSGSMNLRRTTKLWSWLGLRSTAAYSATIKTRKVINTPLTKIRKRLSNGRIGITGTPSWTSLEQPSFSSRPLITGIKTTHNRCNLALPVCCSAAMRNSSPPLMEPLHGVFSPFSISSSVEAGSSGRPTTHVSASNKQRVIIESNGTMSPFKIGTGKRSTSLNPAKSIRYKSNSTTQKPTNRVEVTSSHLDPLAISFFALYARPSLPSNHEVNGTRRSPLTPSPEVSRLQQLLQCSNALQKPKVWTRNSSPDIQYESVMQQHYLKPATENWSSVSQVDGLVRPLPDIHASLVGCC